jgi:hypothetical protein
VFEFSSGHGWLFRSLIVRALLSSASRGLAISQSLSMGLAVMVIGLNFTLEEDRGPNW